MTSTEQKPGTTLVELIAKVEAATGPDRELDHWLSSLMIEGGGSKGFGFHRDRAAWVAASIENRWNAAHFTSSVDAAISLASRLFPIGKGKGKWHWYVDDMTAAVWPDGNYDESAVEAATPALALVLATLRALSSSEHI
jgi:hypothetical protein